MNKLYVGNLSPDVTEETLRNLFEENGVTCTGVLVKKNGFAFVDVDNQNASTLAIDKLNGYNLMGSVIVVEHSVPKRGRRMSPNQNEESSDMQRNRVNIQVHNIPLDVPLQDIQKLLDTFGTVTSCEKGNEGKDGYSANAAYEAPEQAQQAIKQLNRYNLDGSILKVAYKNSLGRAARRFNRNSGPYSGNRQNAQNVDFPVRMLVPSDLVGAIIGKAGATIRQITADTNARVDIHRKENPGSTEKAVTIFGRPDDSTAACRKIMEIMVSETQNTNREGDIPLKLLAHNALVGRLIGKGGSSLKKIMEDSTARITISPLHELTIYNPERTVTVKGSSDQCCQAESLITAKLRTAYEQYMQTLQPQQHNLFPGLNHMALFSGGPEMPPPGPNFNGHRGLPGLYNHAPYGGPPQGPQDMSNETTYMFVPKESVGAIIGVKGENIKAIARKANASIRIAPPDNEAAVERMVTVVGSPEAQWGAQFYIYDKIGSEGIFRQMRGDDHSEVHLRCELQVPIPLVGRIIGKKGARVRELQRVTGARIEVPRESQGENAQNGGDDDKQGGDQQSNEKMVSVKVHGHFFANQAAQRRIRKMLADFAHRQQYMQGRPMRRGAGGERGPRGPGPHERGPHGPQERGPHGPPQ